MDIDYGVAMNRMFLIHGVRKVAVVCGIAGMVFGLWFYVSGHMAWSHPDKPVALTQEYRTYFQQNFGEMLPQDITEYYPIYQELYQAATDTASILVNPFAEHARQHLLATMHYLVPRDQWDNLSPEVLVLMQHDAQLYQFLLQEFHPDTITTENGMLRYFVEYGYALGPGSAHKEVFVRKRQTTTFYIEAFFLGIGMYIVVWCTAFLVFRLVS